MTPAHPAHSSRSVSAPSGLTRPAPVAREVSPDDLPLTCPPKGAEKWNLHPRVFLPLSAASPSASCPYCGAKYRLKGAEA